MNFEWKSQAKKLFKFMKSNRPKDLLMPVPLGGKNPKFSHKSGKWNWARFASNIHRMMNVDKVQFNLAILLKTLITLDFDDMELVDEFETRFPILKTAPMEITSKGRHYILGRTELCDELGLWDKAGCFSDPVTKKSIDKIDLKTVCKTQTGGVLVVGPSIGKTWVRPIWSTSIPDIPEDMAVQLADMYQAKKEKVAKKAKSVGRPVKQSIMPVDDKAIKAAVSVLEKNGFKDVTVVSVTEDGFNFDAQRTPSGERFACPVCKSTHDSNLWWAILTGYPGFEKVAVKNYSSKCKVMSFPMCTGLRDYYTISLPKRFKQQVYDRRRVLPYTRNYRVTAESSTYGTGKTRAAIEFCIELAEALGKPVESLRIVSVATRRAFAINMCNEFAKHGLHLICYLDEINAGRDVRHVEQLSIEMESLWRLDGGDVPDILIVDESEACADVLSSKTMLDNQPKVASEVFKRLVRESGRVLWLDAAATNRGLGCLDRILPPGEEVLFRKNKAVTYCRRAFEVRKKSVFESEEALIDLTIQLLISGKRVVAPVGTKKFGDRLIKKVLETIPNFTEFKYYHGEMDDKHKSDFCDVNKNWAGHRLLMYTGLVTVGISMDLDNQYDVMVVHASVHGPKARDVVQMMHRVRKLVDNVVYYTLDTANRGKRYETSWEGVTKDKVVMLELQRAYLDDPDNLIKCPAWYTWTHQMNEWETRLCRQYLRPIFLNYIRQIGYELLPYEENATAENKSDTDKCISEVNETWAYMSRMFIQEVVAKATNNVRTKYIDIPIVSPEEFVNHRACVHSGKSTSVQKEIVSRHEFDTMYIVNPSIDLNVIAEIYDQTRLNKSLRIILQNKFYEINYDDKGLFREKLKKCGYGELSTKQAEVLGLMKQLCSLLGLHNTHDTNTVIEYATFSACKEPLQRIVDNLFSMLGLRDISEQTNKPKQKASNVTVESAARKPQDPVIKLAKTVGRILKEYGGIGFSSIERPLKRNGTVIRLHDYQLNAAKKHIVNDMVRLLTPRCEQAANEVHLRHTETTTSREEADTQKKEDELERRQELQQSMRKTLVLCKKRKLCLDATIALQMLIENPSCTETSRASYVKCLSKAKSEDLSEQSAKKFIFMAQSLS